MGYKFAPTDPNNFLNRGIGAVKSFFSNLRPNLGSAPSAPTAPSLSSPSTGYQAPSFGGSPVVPNFLDSVKPTVPPLSRYVPIGSLNIGQDVGKIGNLAVPQFLPQQPTNLPFAPQPAPQIQTAPGANGGAPISPSIAASPTTTSSGAAPAVPNVSAEGGVPQIAPKPSPTPSPSTSAPTVSGGASGGTQSPAAFTMAPELKAVVEKAEKDTQEANRISPEELSTQADLDKLSESMRTGYENAAGQAIPMEFITGQKAAIERRMSTLAEPLNTKLARLQAARTASLSASKFSLERADKAAEDARKDWERLNPVPKAPEPYTLAPGETRFGSKNEVVGTGGPKPSTQDLNALLSVTEAQALGVPYGTTRGQAVSGTNNRSTADSQKSLDQIALMKSSLASAKELAHASGRSGIRKTVEGIFAGSTDYTNLVAETNTLRTNVLTLMTDPTIKKFFGPQMSNADVQLMTSTATTLNPELQSPEKLTSELGRLEDLFARAEKAVKQGSSQGSKTTFGTNSDGGGAEYQAYLKAIGQ